MTNPSLNFLIDAQLPISLSSVFRRNGHDSIHASDISVVENPSDNIINKISILQQRIVITKDADFYHSFVLKKEPYKLILVKTGNLKKADLLNLFKTHFAEIIEAIRENHMIELSTTKITVLY